MGIITLNHGASDLVYAEASYHHFHTVYDLDER